MRLLDVGSGPGSITLGMAEVVAPAEVVGVDLQPAQVERARALATERGVANARFEVASVYELPFPDGSFDAAFAHMVVMHLREPVRALREIRRVPRPGGVVGVRDANWSGDLWAPMTPLLEQFAALRVRVRHHNGGDPYLGRHPRRMLLEAGFARTAATASLMTRARRRRLGGTPPSGGGSSPVSPARRWPSTGWIRPPWTRWRPRSTPGLRGPTRSRRRSRPRR
jgi:SAM-dependent methyltransferase